MAANTEAEPRIGAIVAARLESSRLPGKALATVAGRPLLWYVVARLRASVRVGRRIALATTDRSVDDALETWAREAGIPCYRGQTEDVAGRMLGCARWSGLAWFARVNGDSPFVMPSLLDQAAEIALTDPCDVVTNLMPRSFPYGVAVELFATEAYGRAHARMTEPEDREHVSRYVYRHPDEFRIRAISCPEGDLSAGRLTVDTPEDLEAFRRFVAASRTPWVDVHYRDALASGCFG